MKTTKPKLTALEGFRLSEAQRHLTAVREALSRQKLDANGIAILQQAEGCLALMDDIRVSCVIK